MRAGLGSLWVCALLVPLAANTNAAQGQAEARFALYGIGSLSSPPVRQASERYEVRAVAEPPSPAPQLQVGRFSVAAVASANSLVCYNDTLFRDSFDVSGL